MDNKPLTTRVDEIQELVNTKLLNQMNSNNWSMYMSCIGVIRNTEAALESYLIEVSDQLPKESGKVMLYAFGVLEAIYVQQDAVKNMCVALSIKYCHNEDIKEIRETRNDLGHPTDRKDTGHGKEYSYIGNVSPYGNSFVLMTDYPDLAWQAREREGKSIFGVTRIAPINLPEQIEMQKSVFVSVLDMVIETLQKRVKDLS